MNRFTLIVFILICQLNVYSQQQNKVIVVHKDTDDSIFVQIANRWLAAYNSTDAKILAPLYSEDAQYISGHVAGLVANGRDRVIANFAKGMKMGGHLERLEIVSISRSCELATILCKYEANNSGQKASGRNLLVLKKVGNQWLIFIHMTVV